jgi:oxaloacetate decarboxylase gamma subunit
MEANMTMEGIKFMILGMTTVFLFLLLMIAVLKLQTKILNKFFPPKPVSAAPVKSSVHAQSVSTEDEETVAAITAAITEFRKG